MSNNRVTLEQIEASISSEHYFTALEGVVGNAYVTNADEFGHPEDLGLLTLCVLRLWNGFTVLGKSACADPANFDEEIGRKIARADAVNQMWPLLGYELKTNLKLRSEPYVDEASRPEREGAPQAAPVNAGAGEDWAVRAKKEFEELSQRYNKLSDFVGSSAFKALPVEQRQHLANQYYHMEGYKAALEKRLALHRRKTIGFGDMP